MQVSLDEGVFWNQWCIFKKLYPTTTNQRAKSDTSVVSKKSAEAKASIKILELKTFLPLYFKND